jgi:hypothetical protein
MKIGARKEGSYGDGVLWVNSPRSILAATSNTLIPPSPKEDRDVVEDWRERIIRSESGLRNGLEGLSADPSSTLEGDRYGPTTVPERFLEDPCEFGCAAFEARRLCIVGFGGRCDGDDIPAGGPKVTLDRICPAVLNGDGDSVKPPARTGMRLGDAVPEIDDWCDWA